MMKSWFQAAVLFLAIVTASVIPYADPSGAPQDIENVKGVYEPHGVSVQLRAPCRGFSHINNDDDDDDDDEGGDDNFNLDQEFEVKLLKSRAECDASRILINGIPLVRQGLGHLEEGNIVLRSQDVTKHSGGPPEISASWRMVCLDKKASMLIFTVSKIGHLDLPDRSTGFTLSFRQVVPQPLRARNHPTTASESALFESWSQVDPITVTTNTLTVEEEFAKLHEIRERVTQLLEGYTDQESVIYDMLSQEIGQCDGVKCYIQTTLKKSPDILELAKSHLRLGHLGHRGGVSQDQIPVFEDDALASDESSKVASNDLGPIDAKPSLSASSISTPTTSRALPYYTYDSTSIWTKTNRPYYRPRPIIRRPLLLSLCVVVVVMILICCFFICIKVKITAFRDPERRRDCAAQREERCNRAAYRRAACAYRFTKFWSRLRRETPSNSDYEEKRATFLTRVPDRNDAISTEIRRLQRTYQFVNDIVRSHGSNSSSSRLSRVRGSTYQTGEMVRRGDGNIAMPAPTLPPYEPSARTYRPRGRSTSASLRSLPPYEPPSHLQSHEERNYHRSSAVIFPQPFDSITIPAEIVLRGTDSSNGSVRSLPPYQPPPRYEAEVEGEISFIDGFNYTPSVTDSTPDDTNSVAESSVVDCSSEISFGTGSSSSSRR